MQRRNNTPREQDIVKYHRSLAEELIVLKDMVRDLIGSVHWGEDGRYKENILMGVLRRYLPENLSIGTGFVLTKSNHEFVNVEENVRNISKQIDIIIYKNSYPLIFKERDFVIVYPESVVGIIEVKTNFNKNKFKEQLKICEENGRLIKEAQGQDTPIFNGIFYYGVCGREANIYKYIEEGVQVLEELSGRVNHIAIGEDYFVKYWEEGNPQLTAEGKSYSLYALKKLSFSYFISNLVDMSYKKINNASISEAEWFLYPLDDGKEIRRKKNILISNAN